MPYAWRTTDFGPTWTRITGGIPARHFLRVVREDPERRGLLYAGGEFGVYVSFDDGERWQSLRLNLPVVPIHDIAVHGTELVLATHGRSFWILDDLTPLRGMADSIARAQEFLFQPRDVVRFGGGGFGGGPSNAGGNPPSGTVVYAYFRTRPDSSGAISLDFLDSAGTLIRSFSTGRDRGADSLITTRVPVDSIRAGMNRFVWNMRYPDAERVPGAVLWGGSTVGPLAAPGIYQVKLTVGETSQIQTWEWKKDPRLNMSQEEFQEQFDFLIKIRDKLSEVNQAVNRLRSVRSKLDALVGEFKGQEKGAAALEEIKKIQKKLDAVEEALIQAKSKSGQDPLNFPIKLDDKIAALASVVGASDAPPTDQSYDLFKELAAKADAEISKVKTIMELDVLALNKLLLESGWPHISIK
jgi:hypothetical protein